MFPMLAGLILGGLSAFQTFSSSMRQGSQQRQQAAMLQAQASLERRQAEIERQKGVQEQRKIESRREELRSRYRELMGRNRSLLAAGYTDMYSGSAAQVAEGNINRFAADIGENYYDQAMARWQAGENVKRHEYQSRAHAANASYLNRTADNLGTSLLSGVISGVGGFAQGYTMGGGSLKSLFTARATQQRQGLPANFTGPLRRIQ